MGERWTGRPFSSSPAKLPSRSSPGRASASPRQSTSPGAMARRAPDFSVNRLRAALGGQPEGRVEAQILAGLRDRDRALVVSDVVNAGRAEGDDEQRRLGCGIDVDRRLAGGPPAPGARAVKKPV